MCIRDSVKHYSFLLILFMALCLSLGNGNKAQAGSLQTKGVWVSCFEFEELGLKDKTEAQFRANANKIFATIRANGCNTVYFHVRAYDDAIYPSSVAGFSKYISSDGKAPGYDPLKILVSLAHSHKLKIHAWMNPYRVSSTKILDPASETTTARIVNQVKEIINRYAAVSYTHLFISRYNYWEMRIPTIFFSRKEKECERTAATKTGRNSEKT